jgi:hypothetical protein
MQFGVNMKVAITAYVDNVDVEKFTNECNLMTFSGQSLDSRFTFLIYAHPDAIHLIDTYDNVKIIPYIVPSDTYYSDYRFAKSLVFVYNGKDHLSDYDFVCKTDTDVIFTEKMNQFNFNKDKIYVGLGYYSHGPSMEKDMYDLAQKFGYDNYTRIENMHSTIICSTSNIIKIMELSDKLCKEMYYGLEKDGEWGKSIWRGYIGGNSGVCSMYATEIVISSIYDKKNIVVTNTIDAGSDWEHDHKNIYHYHCYHHDFIYSKFQAKFGTYENIQKQSGNSSAAYCINKYIERRDLGKINPELFKKPNFTIFPLHHSYLVLDLLSYSFKKEVD